MQSLVNVKRIKIEKCGSADFSQEIKLHETRMPKKNRAFTLIEILVAIAIVAILASVVLVSMTAFRSKARSAKSLGAMSSVVPAMVSCWGNGTTGTEVNAPVANESGSSNICSLGSGYGKWPASDSGAGDLESYNYSTTNPFDKSAWGLRFRSDTDDKQVCCNKAMNSCKLQDQNTDGSWPACNSGSPTN